MDVITFAADGTFHSFVGVENVGNVLETIQIAGRVGHRLGVNHMNRL